MLGSEYEDVFIDLLERAAVAVAEEYMTLLYVTPEDQVREAYQERVYCYELYHQMRVLMCQAKSDGLAAAVADGWLLNGEVVKKLSYVPGEETPDFIWHKPGEKRNGHVLEVKRANVPWRDIKGDVRKLEEFKRKAGYRHATLLVVGMRKGSDFGDLADVAAQAGVNLRVHREAGTPLAYRHDLI